MTVTPPSGDGPRGMVSKGHHPQFIANCLFNASPWRINTMKFKTPLLALTLCLFAGAGHAQDKLYSVVDGYKVDANTMKGFRTWRAAACDRCHGANQEGMVGPSLLASLKTLTKEEFLVTVRDGRLQKGMQSFGTSPQVMDNIDNLYAYLKGRSDGAITRSKVEEIK
jgi:mono/diheme cytochrome c family protein